MPLSQLNPMQETDTSRVFVDVAMAILGSKAESLVATNSRTSHRAENIMTRQGPLAERSSELCSSMYMDLIRHSQAFPAIFRLCPRFVAMGRLRTAQPAAPRPSRMARLPTANYASPLVTVRASAHIVHGPLTWTHCGARALVTLVVMMLPRRTQDGIAPRRKWFAVAKLESSLGYV